MQRGNKILIWCLMACSSCGLAAQEPAPGSKSEPAPQSLPRVRVSRGVSQAFLVKKVQPEYPQEARAKHIQGQVVVRIVVSAAGDVIQVSLVSGHPLLAQPAMDAVKQWKYKPYLLNGKPVQVATDASVEFNLESADSASDVAPPDLPPVLLGSAPPGEGSVPLMTEGTIHGTIVYGGTKPVILGMHRVGLSQELAQRLLVKKVDPEYPEEARRERIQGAVLLRVLISKAGDVETVDLAQGDLLLASAAKNAVRQWKYKPYFLDDMPVEVDTFIVVKFALSGN